VLVEGGVWRELAVELVDAPEEGGQGLAGAGRGEDQRVLAALDGRPAFNLRRRRLAEGGAEPVANGWGEGLQHVIVLKTALWPVSDRASYVCSENSALAGVRPSQLRLF
jgi:hypothetical protein